jgi:hypothetical protein
LASLNFIAVDTELKFTEVEKEGMPVEEAEWEWRTKEEKDRKGFYTRQNTFLASGLAS